MIRIAICSAEEKVLVCCEYYVRNFLATVRSAGEIKNYRSGDFLLFDVKEGAYFDILLLDSELPDHKGFKVAGGIKKEKPETLVIFLASHSRYAVESYKLSIFRYILKEDIGAKLPPALKDAFDYLSEHEEEMYTICTPTRFERIPYKQILYIHKQDKYSLLTTIDSEAYIRKPLSAVYKEIGSREFAYVNRAYVVHLIHIIKFSDYEILMKNGCSIPVARNRVHELRERINMLWGTEGCRR